MGWDNLCVHRDHSSGISGCPHSQNLHPPSRPNVLKVDVAEGDGGKVALAWWDLLLIPIRKWYNLISGSICLLTSEYPHVPSNIQNTALWWGHGPPPGTRDWQCQFHRLLVNNTICWVDHCLERDGRTWHLTMVCKTYFHTYLWIWKGPCIKKCFGKVAAFSSPPLNFHYTGY